MNWPPVGGRLEGSAFHASVIPGGEHETTVRPDGVGILDVRVSAETDDHALISLRYTGTVDYGADWLDWLRAGTADGDPTNNSAKLMLPNNYLPFADARGNADTAPSMDLMGPLMGNKAGAIR